MAAGEAGLKPIEIRVLGTLEECASTLTVQETVWGFSDQDKVPPRLMLVASKIGGLVLGAYDGARMVGFSMAIPGRNPDGASYLHSHMTGILPDYQDRGLGRALKLRQREEALRQGVRTIEWTFDPLEIRNAFFNIERLGAIARRYEPNLYGITSSKLHGAIPTDRLVAEWLLDSPRAERIAAGGKPEKSVTATIGVPAEASRLRISDPARATAIQAAIRARFEDLFAQGLAVIGYRRTAAGGQFELGPLQAT